MNIHEINGKHDGVQEFSELGMFHSLDLIKMKIIYVLLRIKMGLKFFDSV